MATSMNIFITEDKVVHADKLAIFTCDKPIHEVNIRTFFIKHWKTLSQGLDNSTILFIGGIHGDQFGKLGGKEDIISLKNQVRTDKI